MRADPDRPLAIEDLTRRVEVETPEHVVLGLEIAGLGSRAMAALLDGAVVTTWLALLIALAGLLAGVGVRSPWVTAILLFLAFGSVWGYFTFFEGLRAGQTPGKRWVGLRVVRDTGHPVSFGAAAARNLLRAADFLPPPYLGGALLVMLHPRAKRLGDLVAGTIVVRDRPAERSSGSRSSGRTARRHSPAPRGAVALGPEEIRLLERFRQRLPSLDPESRERLAAGLAARFGSRFPNRPASDLDFVLELEGRIRGRRLPGSASARLAPHELDAPADRLAARKRGRWNAFRTLADRAARRGLDSLAPGELPDFAARYREIAADLARARTYRADPDTLVELERLVAAGHNLLYRDDRHALRRAVAVVGREFPGAVLQARRYVALAFLAFALPAAGGYALLRDRPALAPRVLPQVMLRRAEAGTERSAEGRRYARLRPELRPLAASGIITNNVRVAITCFAGGIFLGVGSLVLLSYNGLVLGAIAGHFANRGLLGYLLEFVAGHGVLELFAIWVAGAAGLLLGRAVVAPGDLRRSDALVVSGRVAVRMVGAALVLLALAGLIEGFVSLGGGGLPLRLSAAAASALFLAAYLLNGRRTAGGPT